MTIDSYKPAPKLDNVIIPEASDGNPSFDGKFGLSFQGGFDGKESEEILKSLSGDGKLTLNEGVLKNLNILNLVLERLSVIPGLAAAIDGRISDEFERQD